MSSLASLILLAAAVPAGPVVINEIHSDPADGPVREEFVEVFNASQERVDLSGWSLSGAIEYELPAGAHLEAGEHLAVAQDPAVLRASFGAIRALGPFSGRLANE